MIENAVFFQFLFFSVNEVLCFCSSLSRFQFLSSSLPSSCQFPLRIPCVSPRKMRCRLKHKFSITPGKGNWKNTAFSTTPGKGKWKDTAFSITPGKGNWKTTAFSITPGKGTGKTRHFQSHPGKGTVKTWQMQARPERELEKHSIWEDLCDTAS